MIRIISVLQHGNFFLFFEKKGRWCSTKKKNAKTRHKTGGGLQLTGVWAKKWKGQEFFLFFAWPHAHLSISPYIKSPSSIRLIAIHFRIRLFDSVTDLCDVGTKKKQLNGRYRVYICWFQPTNVLKGRQRLFLSFFGRRIFFSFVLLRRLPGGGRMLLNRWGGPRTRRANAGAKRALRSFFLSTCAVDSLSFISLNILNRCTQQTRWSTHLLTI